MKRANKLAARFNKLDFHDDALLSVHIRLPRVRNNFTRIDFEFRDDSTQAIKMLSFHNCANIRFVMDFDVLADAWFFGTEGTGVKTSVQLTRKFVRAQMSHWRTSYMPPLPKEKPIKKKLRLMGNYILFQVRFFGGTVEILAKTYKLNH